MNQFRFNVEIKDIEKTNDLFAKCKIYICYADLNRNNSIIPRNVINDNLHTLYNCPIVGEFSKKKEDFLDHGGKVEIDKNGEIEYVTTTIPYGVVPESSEVRWENFNGKDYLTCTGYLWIDRYPEVLDSLEKSSHPQSMEIANVQGEFNDKKQFAVSKFNFSGLCILGMNVEPCFENASIELYSLNQTEFTDQFNLMVNKLKYSLFPEEENDEPNADTDIEIHSEFSNINNNLKEDEAVGKTKNEIASQFSLTVNQLYDEINRALSVSTYKVQDWWTGEEIDRCRFYMRDFDETYVYAVDKMNDYIDVKIGYKMDGDNVVIDFENVGRIKYVPTDWEGGSSQEDDEAAENFTKDFVKEVEAEVLEKKEEFKRTISEKEESVIAIGQKLQDAETKFTAQQNLVVEKETKIAELTSEIEKFQKQEEDEKTDSLLKEFATLISEEEKQELKNKRQSFASFEDFKKEVKSFVCDRVIAKSQEANPNYISMALIDNQEPADKKVDSIWDRLKNI